MSEPTHVRELMSPDILSNEHLLVALSGCSTVRELVSSRSLADLADHSDQELEKAGLPRRAARRLACAFELSRRLGQRTLEPGIVLRNTQDIFEAYHERLRDAKKEHFISLLMNAKNRLIREEVVSVGILTSSLVHPREVFMPAIRHSAAGIVLIHNHPSGDPEPSAEDRKVTRRLAAVGELVGIQLLDHVVIGDGTYASFLERGLLG